MSTRGGKRPGAGRPSKAVELKIAERFENILASDEVIKKLAIKVKQGDMKAIELWLGYVYGKPKQIIESEKPLDMIIRVIDDTE